MKVLFELFRRFDARRIFDFIRRLGGMSRPKVKCYDLRSTRALRVEGDDKDTETHTSTHTFLSTPSGWRATVDTPFIICPVGFLSTPSGWRATRIQHISTITFTISIHALRVEGDISALARTPALMVISIHALRVEGDLISGSQPPPRRYFYPRPPGGGRLLACSRFAVYIAISIHALRVEGDLVP